MRARQIDGKAPPARDLAHRGIGVKADVGEVARVMLLLETVEVAWALREDRKPSVAPEQTDEPGELLGGAVEVLRRLRASDEIVARAQRLGVALEERVVSAHAQAALAQQSCQRVHRPRS